jgi:hemerythrin-like domain-containing protein
MFGLVDSTRRCYDFALQHKSRCGAEQRAVTAADGKRTGTMSQLSELGKVLHEEHFRIVMLLCDLEHRVTGTSASEPLDPRREADRRELGDLVFCLDQIIDHNAFEEAELFPLLCANDDGDLAALLTEEHRAIGPLATRLRAVASAILEHGTDNRRWQDFKDVAAEMVPAMMFHLQKEEMTVVQRLDRILDSRVDGTLARKHSAERAPIRKRPAVPGLGGGTPTASATIVGHA